MPEEEVPRAPTPSREQRGGAGGAGRDPDEIDRASHAPAGDAAEVPAFRVSLHHYSD